MNEDAATWISGQTDYLIADDARFGLCGLSRAATRDLPSSACARVAFNDQAS
jgi:hypothetical protein